MEGDRAAFFLEKKADIVIGERGYNTFESLCDAFA